MVCHVLLCTGMKIPDVVSSLCEGLNMTKGVEEPPAKSAASSSRCFPHRHSPYYLSQNGVACLPKESALSSNSANRGKERHNDESEKRKRAIRSIIQEDGELRRSSKVQKATTNSQYSGVRKDVRDSCFSGTALDTRDPWFAMKYLAFVA